MNARRLPDTVRVLGVDAHLHEPSGSYHSDDGDGHVTPDAEIIHGNRRWAALATRGKRDDWTQRIIEGPWAESPQAARDALHAFVRELAEKAGGAT